MIRHRVAYRIPSLDEVVAMLSRDRDAPSREQVQLNAEFIVNNIRRRVERVWISDGDWRMP